MIFLIIFSILNLKAQIYFKEKEIAKLWIEPEEKVSLSRLSKILEKGGGRMRTISIWNNMISGLVSKKETQLSSFKTKVKNVYPVSRGKTLGKEANLNKEDYGDSYKQLSLVGIPELHKRGYMGQGITISIFDTGFNLSHPALNHLKEGNRIKFTYDFNSGDSIFVIFNENKIKIPFPFLNTICYINSFDIISKGDTFFVFYSYLEEEKNTQGIWEIYGVKFVGNERRSEIKKLSDVNPSILPSSIKKDTNIYLIYKELKNDSSNIKINIMDIYLNIINSYILVKEKEIKDLEIIEFDGDIYLFYSNEKEFSSFRLKDSLKTVLKDKTLSEFSLSVKDSFIYCVYEIDTIPSVIGLLKIDKDFNIVKDTIISQGFSPYCIFENNLKTIFISSNKKDYLNFYEFDSELNIVDKARVDSGYFIKSPLVSGNNFYYAKNGYLFRKSDNTLDTLSFYFVDLIDKNRNFLIYRRRGDRNVNIVYGVDFIEFTSALLHGTRMLGLIGGYAKKAFIGSAPSADFILFKTEKVITKAEGNEFENIIEEDFWVEALELSYLKGARIVSSSLGYSEWYEKKDMDGKTSISSRAASRALSKGILVFTAAGNLNFTHSIPDTTIVAPGDADSVITVGGMKYDSTIWEYSSFGPTADGRIKPDLVGPVVGWSVWFEAENGDTTYTYALSEGTSIATAILAGMGACIWSAHPSWSAKKLYEVMKKTASRAKNPDNIYGWGIPSSIKALYYEQPEIPLEQGEIESRILSIYPVPVKDNLNIVYIIAEPLTPLKLKIMSPSGKSVFKKEYFIKSFGVYRERIDLKKVSPGFYYFIMETGNYKDFKKIIVE